MYWSTEVPLLSLSVIFFFFLSKHRHASLKVIICFSWMGLLGCLMGVEGVKAIGKALEVNKMLSWLNLGCMFSFF